VDAAELVDAHVHLTFATHGENPAPRGSAEIQELYLREQAAAGVTLVRDCGAIPQAVAPPSGPGLPTVISCGPLLAPDIPFLAHLRTAVAADALEDVVAARMASGASWVKLLADAPGADGNMLAAQPTYPLELVGRVCDVVHDAGGRVAAHTTGPAAPALVDAGVDSIEHGICLDAEAVARLGARGGAWTPTLSTVMWHLQPMIDAGHPAAPMLERHLDALAATLSGAVAAGVVVMAGTDERPHGSIQEEIALLQSFGLTPADAVAAASNAARDYLTAAQA
jgi:imidazolonepropionase-like amidohydrolase